MAFKLRPREVTKEDEKKLCRNYTRLLKKNDSNTIKVISKLFLELMCLYFSNPKSKLKKIFFPVIIANLIEQGSINSVIEEYQNKKKLYSESYTCRILRQLDEEAGLEISRIFRKILFKILKRIGLKNKGYCIAIDITAKPFYGNKNLCMVKGTKKKAGTNFAMQYLTASIVEEGVRFNLLCIPISSTTLIDRKLNEMILEIEKTVSIKLLYLDRGFANKKYCRIIKSLKYKFIMPITKNRKLCEIERSIKEQSSIDDESYTLSELDYIFYEKESKEYQESVKLLALHEDDHIFFFITNIYNLESTNYYGLIESYRYRFGIETNYRVDNIFCALTSSIRASMRYLLMQISLIVQDLWTLANFILHSPEKRQPREYLKGNYSIKEIILARVASIGFIWRPIIGAIQFKRKMERILG
ncbi:MAG: hypothetical protein KKE23_03830 [Nanoarchaeota archaeon]|nr:hypothetical protein [Nanoarchaeota archaeon]